MRQGQGQHDCARIGHAGVSQVKRSQAHVSPEHRRQGPSNSVTVSLVLAEVERGERAVAFERARERLCGIENKAQQVRPEWRRASLIGARGCLGWHQVLQASANHEPLGPRWPALCFRHRWSTTTPASPTELFHSQSVCTVALVSSAAAREEAPASEIALPRRSRCVAEPSSAAMRAAPSSPKPEPRAFAWQSISTPTALRRLTSAS